MSEEVHRCDQTEREGLELEVAVAEPEAEIMLVSRRDWNVEEGVLEVQRGGPVSLLE